MRHVGCMIAVAALTIPAAAFAQVPTAPSSTTDERRLTAEQVEAILAEAAKKREAAEARVPFESDAAEQQVKPQVHGEVGVAIGTGGYREVFGTAIYPLGDAGVAAISMDFVGWGKRRYPH